MPDKEKTACYEHAAPEKQTCFGEPSSAPEYTSSQRQNLVRVLRIVPAKVTSEVKAFVTVQVGPVQIAGIRVLVPLATGRPRVEFPMQQSSGGQQWPVVKISDPELREFVEDAVLATWRDAFVLQGKGSGGNHGRRR